MADQPAPRGTRGRSAPAAGCCGTAPPRRCRSAPARGCRVVRMVPMIEPRNDQRQQQLTSDTRPSSPRPTASSASRSGSCRTRSRRSTCQSQFLICTGVVVQNCACRPKLIRNARRWRRRACGSVRASLLGVVFHRLVVRDWPRRPWWRSFSGRPTFGVGRRDRLHEPLVVELGQRAVGDLALDAVVHGLLGRPDRPCAACRRSARPTAPRRRS